MVQCCLLDACLLTSCLPEPEHAQEEDAVVFSDLLLDMVEKIVLASALADDGMAARSLMATCTAFRDVLLARATSLRINDIRKVAVPPSALTQLTRLERLHLGTSGELPWSTPPSALSALTRLWANSGEQVNFTPLSGLPALRNLNPGLYCTSAALGQIRTVTTLRELFIERSQDLSATAFRSLAPLTALQGLTLVRPLWHVTDASIVAMAQMLRSLTSLKLH